MMTAQTKCRAGELRRSVKEKAFLAGSTRSEKKASTGLCEVKYTVGSTRSCRAGKPVFMLLTGIAKLPSLDKT